MISLSGGGGSFRRMKRRQNKEKNGAGKPQNTEVLSEKKQAEETPAVGETGENMHPAEREISPPAYELTFLHVDKEGVLHRRSIGKSTLLWALSIPVLFVILIVLLYEQRLASVEEQNKEAQMLADTLRNNIIQQATETDTLNRRITELQQSNEELTLALTEKDGELITAQESNEEEKIPGAYPILGSAQLILPEEAPESEGAGGGDTPDENTEAEEKEEPAVFFRMGAGCRVVAAGSGRVAAVTFDEDANTTIEIDHGNGYHSFYTGRGVHVLNEGEWAAAGSVLLIPAAEGTEITYRITRDGRYIDPMEFMEVDG